MSQDNTMQQFIDRIPGLVFSLSPHGKVLAMNRGAESVLGKPASHFLGKKGFGLLGDEAVLRAVFTEGTPTTFPLRRDGILHSVSAEPVTNEDGDVTEATFTVQVVPEDSNQSAKLSALDRVMARIEFSLTGEVLDVNDAFLAVTGYARSEVVGQHHRMFATSAFRGSREYDEFWARLNRGEFVSGEFERVGKDGRTIFIQASYNPIFDERGRPTRVVKFASDVTASVVEREAARTIRAMVDNSPNPTMLCDRDLRITYVNAVATEKLAALQKFLPIPVERLVGHSIDVFHKHPEHQRKLLQDPRNLPHTARIQVGPETLRLQVYAIFDAKGEYAGPALAWEIITDQVARDAAEKAAAKEAARVRAVVDNSPNPTMLLDLRDMRITYANPVAIKTLARLEQHLPIRASEIVGSSVDVFHKHPEHQRRLLADPKNLPHEARIQVGPETLHLQVYALYDESGTYSGPALQWNIITERAAMEKRDAEAKRAVNVVQAALARVAEGDVDVTIEESFDGELNVMRDNVNQIAEVLRDFNGTMLSLSDSARAGRLGERADAGRFRGAYSEIIRGVNNILDAIMSPVEDIREKLGLVAKGDLTAYVEADYEGDHGELKNALNRSLDGLNDLLGQISTAAQQIGSSSSQVASAAQDLSQGASEQAATIEEISAQMSQITTQTQQNAENASQANQLALAARDGARAGDVRMNEMLGAMREIEEASNNISKIIKVIDEIAFQTNLLALNAAVEAARAGVHGKGFAVVAEEVRNLAARSARAAKETTEMIEGSIKKVALGTGIAKETATALGAIVQDVGKVTDLVAEIAAASNEQAEGINQINSGLDQVNLVTQRNTATAEESAASAQETSGQVADMQRMVSRFALREVHAAGGLPAGMTPEMMTMVQAYVERLLGGRAPEVAAHRAPPAPRVERKEAAKTVIHLDSPDFGKY